MRRSAWLTESSTKQEESVVLVRWLTWERVRAVRWAKNASILLSNAASEEKRLRCWSIWRTVIS